MNNEPNHEDGYYYLKDGVDRITYDCEIQKSDGSWAPIHPWHVRSIYRQEFYYPIRRPKPTTSRMIQPDEHKDAI